MDQSDSEIPQEVANPHLVPIDHPDFFPDLEFSAVLPPHCRDFVAESLKLETTGATEQKNQRELFNRQLVYKSSVAAKLKQAGCWDLVGVLDECSSKQSWAQCTGCAKVRTFWNRCDNFYCPACQPHLARERFESLEWWTKTIEQPKHVVLTVRNTARLTFKYVKWFKDCFKRLRRRKFASNWLGGLWSMECTRGHDNFHLHMHALIDARWIDQMELSAQWAELVGQDYAIVKVKDARGIEYLREVTKYAVKGSELAKWTGQQIAEFVNAFSGQKNFGVFGSLHGKRKSWREWVDRVCISKGACDCGCNTWKIFDADAWSMHTKHQAIIRGAASIPPPRRPQESQHHLAIPVPMSWPD